jgi:hypothetical protein
MRQLLTIQNPIAKQLVGVLGSKARFLKSCSMQWSPFSKPFKDYDKPEL